MGVSLVQVNGTFQRGINPAEAKVMVEHIVKFMKSDRERSLGVVVMNQSQMEQIDAMILREAELDSQVAEYIDQWAAKDEGLNRFFVKNLENVQGDERDVIFIGTTYGCDPTGKFYQRFGPINGPSGKRRLNVLFSRAKEQIVTFSSIPVEKFQPSDTNEGAKLLKLWLQFAATKRLGESLAYSGRGGVPDSPFEEHVISAIESIGYQPVPQVGVSGYYIDIGVKHPDYPMGYICGVECDGASYHSAKNARDRDRLRQEVLERLGWDLHRIWSTDWFRDPYGQTQRMRDVLDRLLEKRLADLPALESPSLGESAHEATESLQADSTLTHNRFMEVADAYEVAEEEPKHLDSAPDSERRDIRRQVVNVGSKIELRYLDGARAGISARFWLTDLPDTDSYSVPGFTTLRTEAPLGKALIEACVGDIVSYPLQDGVVRVEILQELSPSTSESTLPSLSKDQVEQAALDDENIRPGSAHPEQGQKTAAESSHLGFVDAAHGVPPVADLESVELAVRIIREEASKTGRKSPKSTKALDKLALGEPLSKSEINAYYHLTNNLIGLEVGAAKDLLGKIIEGVIKQK